MYVDMSQHVKIHFSTYIHMHSSIVSYWPSIKYLFTVYLLHVHLYIPDMLLLLSCNVQSTGELELVRRSQQRRWLWSHVSWQLMARFRQWPGMAELVTAMENRVVAGSMAPGTAADLLLDEFFSQRSTITRDK